jgi:hypothetical protein
MYFLFSGGLLGRNAASFSYLDAPATRTFSLDNALDITVHWIYHQIRSGRIQVTKDPETGMYLFPDTATTLTMFDDLKDGQVSTLRF